MRSAAAAKSTQKGSHMVCEATARVAPAMSIANGSGGSVAALFGSATGGRKLFQTALPARESFTERHPPARQLQPVTQGRSPGKHGPTGKPGTPHLRHHARGP